MSSYQEYQAKIAELQALANQARENELADAKSKIFEIMSLYGLTLADLANGRPTRAGMPRAAAEAKYQDPASGQKWTGRGRAPKWLEGRNREDFLIKQ